MKEVRLDKNPMKVINVVKSLYVAVNIKSMENFTLVNIPMNLIKEPFIPHTFFLLSCLTVVRVELVVLLYP